MYHFRLEADVGMKAVEEVLNRYGTLSWDLVHVSRNPDPANSFCLIFQRQQNDVIEYLESLREEKRDVEEGKKDAGENGKRKAEPHKNHKKTSRRILQP